MTELERTEWLVKVYEAPMGDALIAKVLRQHATELRRAKLGHQEEALDRLNEAYAEGRKDEREELTDLECPKCGWTAPAPRT